MSGFYHKHFLKLLDFTPVRTQQLVAVSREAESR